MRFTVEGKQVPRGQVRVSGAKNAATRLMAAALLTDDAVVLTNFPTELLDVRNKAAFMEALGATLAFDSQRSQLKVEGKKLACSDRMDFNVPVRTTYLLAAGQMRQLGIARVPYPGGCKLGERKYDLHLMVWRSFGSTVRELDNHIEVRCPRLHGAVIDFPMSTVGGTENALLCAAVAEGSSLIRNAYVTPEVRNLISLLRAMGADVEWRGRGELVVEGQPRLHGAKVPVIPDRIEALSWMVYAAIAGGDVTIHDVPFADMEVPLIHLRHAGVEFYQSSNSMYIQGKDIARGGFRPFELACGTHPGIISDMQPFFVLLAMNATGRSLVVDYRYPDRTAYLAELVKFSPGALEWQAGRIRITGPAGFTAANAASTDLRGSMALVLAALVANGTSHVENVDMALRGYNDLAAKLTQLGLRTSFSAP